LDFIKNPPADCKITQICPPARLTAKRATTDIKIMKADYEIGLRSGANYLSENLD
jgi:predicted patatin/cPLA2 family phospholipase